MGTSLWAADVIWQEGPDDFYRAGLRDKTVKDWAGALENYDKALALDDSRGDIWAERGLAHRVMGLHSVSVEGFRRSTDLEDTSTYYKGFSYLHIGEMKVSSEYLRMAINNFEVATAEAPTNPDGWVLLGRAQRELWRLIGGQDRSLLWQSLTYIERAAAIAPNYTDAWAELEVTRKLLGR